MAKIHVISLLLATLLTIALGQENTQTSVAKSLQECYNSTETRIKDHKLPMTLDVLLDLIRKVERGPNRMNLREMAVNILQRFRQDGIVRAVGINTESMSESLPYSPNGRQNDKFRMILKYLVPGSAMQFPNETLTIIERCTLHSMLSSSIEDWERGDEGSVCNRLGKYQRRVVRGVMADADVEVIDENTMDRKGDIKNDPNSEVDKVPTGKSINAKSSMPKSDCPVENGVISTQWGAISTGALIAGIAAGAQYDENIQLRNIAEEITNDMKINNLWGSTLAGDLAEAALYKNEEDDVSDRVEIGAAGGWNSTQIPRWYFLKVKNHLDMTDAEIRGGLDGFILGKLFESKLNNAIPNLKLSQLLDMYYSQRGIFNKYKACNRKNFYKEFAPSDEMIEQASAFAIALDKRVRLRISLTEKAIFDLVKEASDSLDRYIPSMNDAQCLTYSAGDDSTVSTDIIIALDFQWPFEMILPALSYFLTNIEINQYNSNFTIINAQSGAIVINSTYAITDLYSTLNATSYKTFEQGFNFPKSLRKAEELAKLKMLDERFSQNGGKSLITLFVPYTDPTDGTDKTYVIDRVKDIINVLVPDLNMIILSKGNKEVYTNIVKDTSRDVIIFTPSSEESMIMNAISPLIERVKQVPRRFTNSKCGSDWKSEGSDRQLVQEVQPGSVNFYRVHPNYFFGSGTKSIKIRGQTQGTLTICESRSTIQPKANQSSTTASDVTCKPTTEEYSISLTNACEDKTTIQDCAPLYFSVAAPVDTAQTTYSCDDCRYPYNTKFTIASEGLECASSANILITNFFMVITLLSAVLVKMYAN